MLNEIESSKFFFNDLKQDIDYDFDQVVFVTKRKSLKERKKLGQTGSSGEQLEENQNVKLIKEYIDFVRKYKSFVTYEDIIVTTNTGINVKLPKIKTIDFSEDKIQSYFDGIKVEAEKYYKYQKIKFLIKQFLFTFGVGEFLLLWVFPGLFVYQFIYLYQLLHRVSPKKSINFGVSWLKNLYKKSIGE